MKSDAPIGSVGGVKPLGDPSRGSRFPRRGAGGDRRRQKARVAGGGRASPLRFLLDIAICFAAGALQVAAARYVPYPLPKPCLPLVAAAALGVARGPEAGALAGLALGLYMDAEWSKTMGVNALALLYVGVIAGLLGRWRAFRSLSAVIAVCGALSAAYEAATGLLLYALPVYMAGYEPSVGIIYAASRIIVPAACMNSLLAAPVYLAFRPRPYAVLGVAPSDGRAA